MRRFWWVPMAATVALGVVGAASEQAAAEVELGDCVSVEVGAEGAPVESRIEPFDTAAASRCSDRP